jgi:hypothetical protein
VLSFLVFPCGVVSPCFRAVSCLVLPRLDAYCLAFWLSWVATRAAYSCCCLVLLRLPCFALSCLLVSSPLSSWCLSLHLHTHSLSLKSKSKSNVFCPLLSLLRSNTRIGIGLIVDIRPLQTI